MTSALDVVTFGEAMLLLVADRPGPREDAGMFHKRTAGAETNVAIGLARLGLRVGWSSRPGTDMMGRYLMKAMVAEGIDCSRVALDPAHPTGFMLKGRVWVRPGPEEGRFLTREHSLEGIARFYRQRGASFSFSVRPALRPACRLNHALAIKFGHTLLSIT